jgi:alpha-1,2-mannosyltransferase
MMTGRMTLRGGQGHRWVLPQKWHDPRSGLLIATAVASWLLVAVYVLVWARHWLTDLEVYTEGSRALREHLNPYSLVFTPHRLNFTYPPFALLCFLPLTVWPRAATETVFCMATAVATVWVAYIAIGASRLSNQNRLALAAIIGAVSTLALEPLRSNLDYGQIDVLLMLAVVLDLARRHRLSGVLIGFAAAIKLTPLVFVLILVVRRDWASTARCLGAFFVVTAVSWVVLPTEWDQYWLHLVFRPRRIGGLVYAGNQSWYGMLARLAAANHDHYGWVWLLLVAVTLSVGLVAANLALKSGELLLAIVVVAMAELLVSPVSWTHQWSWLLLAVPLVVDVLARRKWVALALLGGLVVAVAAPYWWSGGGPFAWVARNSLLLMGAVILATSLVSLLRTERREPRQPLLEGDAT